MSLCSTELQNLHSTLAGGGGGGSGGVVRGGGGGADIRGVEEGDGGGDGSVGVGEEQEGDGVGGAAPSSWGIPQLGGGDAVPGEWAALRFFADLVSLVVGGEGCCVRCSGWSRAADREAAGAATASALLRAIAGRAVGCAVPSPCCCCCGKLLHSAAGCCCWLWHIVCAGRCCCARGSCWLRC